MIGNCVAQAHMHAVHHRSTSTQFHQVHKPFLNRALFNSMLVAAMMGGGTHKPALFNTGTAQRTAAGLFNTQKGQQPSLRHMYNAALHDHK